MVALAPWLWLIQLIRSNPEFAAQSANLPLVDLRWEVSPYKLLLGRFKSSPLGVAHHGTSLNPDIALKNWNVIVPSSP
jgi:hypothetical protein